MDYAKMTEDDTFNVLKSTAIVQSEYGGYYLFLIEPRIKEVNDYGRWGYITLHGKISDILNTRAINHQNYSEWIGGFKQEKIFHAYCSMSETYARHVTETHPEPGGYWDWKK